MMPAGADAVNGIALFAAELRVALHELRVAENGVERRANLVAHAGEEVGLGLIRRSRSCLSPLANHHLVLQGEIGFRNLLRAPPASEQIRRAERREGEARHEHEP